jgi:E3 ubiquitin-protein ligase HECTD4
MFLIMVPLLSQVVGKGVLGSVGVVMSINEQEGIATVKFPSCEYRKACKASDILTVPISRLCTPRSEVRTGRVREVRHA